ncbi:MAG: 1,2-phenylacetyl-CoA epoxidase subunit PaaD [Casimicrobiaceae bacterium]
MTERIGQIESRDAPSSRAGKPDPIASIWRAVGSVIDPEIPMISIVELGIVRDVARAGDEWVITLTPTYSGCPATRVIETDVRSAVAAVSDASVRIVTTLSPPWSSDWIAPEARRKLCEAGIAPPHPSRATGIEPRPIAFRPAAVRCPNCGSVRTQELSRFGSTACKAQYRCADCLEPFDYFKPY